LEGGIWQPFLVQTGMGFPSAKLETAVVVSNTNAASKSIIFFMGGTP